MRLRRVPNGPILEKLNVDHAVGWRRRDTPSTTEERLFSTAFRTARLPFTIEPG
jgi:hypothetical protein